MSVFGTGEAHAQGSANDTSPLGSNLHFFRDWASEWTTVDAFKQSRPWYTQCHWLGGQPDCTTQNAFDTEEAHLLDLDADGWVRSLPRPSDPPRFWTVATQMFTDMAGHYPVGRYVVLYQGQGTLEYGYGATKNEALSAPGRDVIDVVSNPNGIQLKITSTDPLGTGNYIRNIRVIMPGFESTYTTQPFHPDAIARLAPYRTLRFMMWGEINGSTQTAWADRPRPASARYSEIGVGVPFELMVDLANTVGADAWLNVPHMVDDTYVSSMASLVLGRLSPSQKVYVEYSNEIWNDANGFPQGAWVEQQANALWPNSTASSYEKRLNWYGRRAAQICDIWKSVWGAQADRVVCVMGAQSSNAWSAAQALDCALWTEGAPCSAHGFDYVAIAPYISFGMYTSSIRDQVVTWATAPNGLDLLFQEIFYGGVIVGGWPGGELAHSRDATLDHVATAAARGLGVIAYEAGAELFDPMRDPATIALFQAANRDPRMGVAYDQYLLDWRNSGAEMMVHFVNLAKYDNNGAAGALEYMYQAGSPKHDALMEFIDTTACWWGCMCGNGVIDRGEQCDDGNTANGDCCSSACQFEPSSTVCRSAAGVCDVADYCTGTSASCPSDSKSTAVCRPVANACDVAAESCTGSTDSCPADGAIRDCSSMATACRAASCDPVLGCTWTATNEGGACNDGNPNTSPDVCVLGACTQPNPVPMLSSFTPTSVNVGSAGVTVTLTGSSFRTNSYVTWNGAAMATTFVSATTLTISVPASSFTAAGYATIQVHTPTPGGGSSAQRTFTVNNLAPTVTLLAPVQTTVGAAGVTIGVNGTNFARTTYVTFNGTSVPTTYVSATRVDAAVPASLLTTAGTRTVTAVTPAPGGGSASRTFTVNNATPTLTSLSPTSTPVNTTSLVLTVNGTNFLSGALVRFNGTYYTSTFVSSTRLTATIPGSQLTVAGSYDVQALNPSPTQGPSTAIQFSVSNAATLTMLTPAAATAGSPNLTLTLDGSGFAAGAVATFNGTNLTTTFVSATRLTATVPAASIATEGTYNATVVNPGSTASAARTFTVGRPLMYSLSNATQMLPGSVAVGDEDLFRLHTPSSTYAMYFDGSVRGVPTTVDVDAFHVNADGSILMSFDATVTVGGVAADSQDIVRWVPSTNTWSMYFDGSDVGLTTIDEDIDALAILADGRILISTLGAFSVTGVTGEDEDIIAFTPTTTGANTAGTFAMYFDGSDVALGGVANLDVDAITIAADGSLLISILGAGTVPSVGAATGDDVIRLVNPTFGDATSCNYQMHQAGAAVGLTGGVDGLY
ncbi:hypothetical protein L6R52_05595 [Myxococcota bacterium]|nr:hypothetical protein [Myxococcota bacterium]